MNHVFDPDNMLFSTLARLVDLVGLSLLWGMLCIPIVTIGPATAALYYTVVKVFRHGAQNGFQLFFQSLWLNLKSGLLATLCLIPGVVLLVLLGHWYTLAAETFGGLGLMAYAFFYVFAILAVGLVCWLFPLLGRFEFTLRQLFSTALKMMVAHLPTTLLAVGLAAGAYVLTLRLLIFILLVPVLWAVLVSFPMERAFAKHMPAEEPEGEQE